MLTQARAFSTEALKVVNNVAKQRFEVAIPNGTSNNLFDLTGTPKNQYSG